MKTLKDAWQWYQDTKRSLKLIHRLGEKHWSGLSDATGIERLFRDDAFRTLEASDIVATSSNALTHLDDLAIVVLFSVFEAILRESIVDDIVPQAENLRHQSLKVAARDMIEMIRFGSFFRLLDLFRESIPDLTEEVNQVRKYRNWVAHGKRGPFENAVTPDAALDRLERFLAKILPSNSNEKKEPKEEAFGSCS